MSVRVGAGPACPFSSSLTRGGPVSPIAIAIALGPRASTPCRAIAGRLSIGGRCDGMATIKCRLCDVMDGWPSLLEES